MLYTICIALILVASVLVILAVLVQNPKSGMAANFGASNQVMGVRETTNFLEKFTWSMAIAIVVLSLAATLAMDRGLVADSNLEISKDAKALQEGGGDLAVIEDRGFFPRSFFRPSGGGPAWDDSSGGGRNGPAAETPEGRLAISEVVCLPERDGEFPPVFCVRPEPLRFMYWKSPRDAPRAFLCRFESLREAAPPPTRWIILNICRLRSSGHSWVPPPLGENGQRCCGLKAPMVLIRSSKSSRETSVCPLIFDR